MAGKTTAISDEEFLLLCIKHAENIKINYTAVVRDLGYSSDKVASNRMRNLRKKLQSSKQEGGAGEDAEDETQVEQPTTTTETDEEPKRKKQRGRKRKAST
ncbi:hypothetical protein H072_4058 [Dactylellina haptotyla CBS 200.50]|uniref:Myb-like DNA-binding domain-containing protein n=1 Tax=Dactylellina haptotyla (strain CBS 200.50) TaxID=1284197 RepID=S8BR89_DACHA|nr:hypothetical protein H072_4058 [Dactylellina haptotyla CBS 200.50]